MYSRASKRASGVCAVYARVNVLVGPALTWSCGGCAGGAPSTSRPSSHTSASWPTCRASWDVSALVNAAYALGRRPLAGAPARHAISITQRGLSTSEGSHWVNGWPYLPSTRCTSAGECCKHLVTVTVLECAVPPYPRLFPHFLSVYCSQAHHGVLEDPHNPQPLCMPMPLCRCDPLAAAMVVSTTTRSAGTVLRSMTQGAQEVFRVLAEEQLEALAADAAAASTSGGAGAGIGVTFQRLH